MRRTGFLAVLIAVSACGGPRGPAERMTVPPGATLGQITDTLVNRGVIRSGWWFKAVTRLRGLDRDLQAGVYDIVPGTPTSGILEILVEGREAMVVLTVPEGLTLSETAALAALRLGISAEAFLEETRDTGLVREVAPDASSIEGYLFPETYTVPVSVTARGLVELMGREFDRHWRPHWNARLDTLGLTRDQLVTLASIVEGEARVDDERPIIAGVYHNRLRRGMRLQADPTVQYAIQLATGERKPRLFLKDYEFESPYNTYLIAGLPPGPVNSPGHKSLEASLYPADVPYLYFVADSTGRHVFTRTFREHQNAIRRLRGR